MVQLNRSMMERYEIADRRPKTTRAILLGADRLMLGGVARMLDLANEAGADIGAACVTGGAEALNAQNGMFTMLVRGEDMDERRIQEERVVQSVTAATAPEADYDGFLMLGRLPQLELIFAHAEEDGVEEALLARVLYSRWQGGMPAPTVVVVAEHCGQMKPEEMLAGMRRISTTWRAEDEFQEWLKQVPLRTMFCDTLCGRLGDAEAAREQQRMNYRDDYLAWAEPQLRCVMDGEVPERLRAVCKGGDTAFALERRARILDAAMFLCTAAGYLCGKDSFAEVLGDAGLRAWIGHAFFDEILPTLPWSKEEVAPEVISAFERLENPMNHMPLLAVGRDAMRHFRHSILPSMRAYADKRLEAPKGLAFGLSAAIMLCAGARESADGEYEVLRGDQRAILHDDREILEAFSRLSHDMPADTLAYAALADRSVWGCDLREIDGLEMRVSYDLSAIQRIGFRESLKLKLLEWEED